MTAGVGHNSQVSGEAKAQLKSLVERIENVIDNELNPAKEAIKEIFAEAKGHGFDVASVRKIVTLRGKDRAKLIEQKQILELYAVALGVEDLV